MKKLIFAFVAVLSAYFAFGQHPKVNSSIYFESFDGTELAVGWSSVDLNADHVQWGIVSDIDGEALNPTNFVVANAGSASTAMDDALETPVIDLSGEYRVVMTVDEKFEQGSDIIADIEAWDGSQWVVLNSQSHNDYGDWGSPRIMLVDVSDYLNSDFKMRFHYHGDQDDYLWALDNFTLWGARQANFNITSAGEPLSGVKLDAFIKDRNSSSLHALSDNNGYAKLNLIKYFTFYVVAQKDGYLNDTVEVYIESDADVTIDMELTQLAAIDNKNTDVKLYPNPASDYVTVENAPNSVVSIFDASGKKVYEGKVRSSRENINISGLNSGVFWYEIKGDDFFSKGKLLKK